MLNADFDGDSMALYRVHDSSALEELRTNAHILNNIRYDQNDEMISRVRLESAYSLYLLMTATPDMTKKITIIDSLDDLPNKYELNINYEDPIQINGKIYCRGICLVNKWSGFKQIELHDQFSGNSLSSKIFENSKSNKEYHKRLSDVNSQLAFFISTHPSQTLTLALQEIGKLDISEERELLSYLPKNPHIGQHIYQSICNRIYDKIPESFQLKKLTKVKISRTQLFRIIAAIGYVADDKNIINSSPIPTTIYSGLNPDLFFLTAIGTRKGIVDKHNITPASGYLERSMVVNLSPIELGLDDCGTNLGFTINLVSENHVNSMRFRYYYNEQSSSWEIFNPKNPKKHIYKSYLFRSPITCGNPDFKICKKCFGKYENIKTKFVGILAGQYISERFTQLSMRTFHTSGSCSLTTNPEVVGIIQKHLVRIEHQDNHFQIILDRQLNNDEVYMFRSIPGFNATQFVNGETYIDYINIFNVKNEDIALILKEVNDLLKQQLGKKLTPISEVYSKFINNILSVGQIYSSFVEIVLCNMYLVENDIIFRYALQTDNTVQAVKKLSVKKLHSVVSKLLGLIYEPNEASICKFSNNSDIIEEGHTIFEKIWRNNF